MAVGLSIAAGFLLVLWYDRMHSWDGVPIALLWAFACVAFGGISGFLFAVPKVMPQSFSAESNAEVRVTGLVANTNIEQISDWLTKIIVGLGLVHLKYIPEYLDRLASVLTTGLGVNYGAGPHSFSIALIVYFSIVGFFGGYLLTRLYISPLIGSADGRIANYAEGRIEIAEVQVPDEFKRIVSEKEFKDILAKPVSSPRDVATQGDESTTAISRKISTIKEEKISDPVSYAAWAMAQLNLGNSKEALRGFKQAIQTFTNDVKLRYEYAMALHHVGRHQDSLEELEKALQLSSGTQDVSLQGRVYNGLAYVSLYLKPPKGFETSIYYGEKAVSQPNHAGNVWLWVNLAAAYGQQATFIKEKGDSPESFSAARSNALRAIRQALSLDVHTLATFQKLIQKNFPKPVEENDLEVFENDPEFRKLLEL